MRFNKQNVKDALIARIARLEEQWNFDPNNGYDQVKNSDFHRVMAYGEYDALGNFLDVIEYNLL
jgi:hypothetical protein